MNIYKPGEGIEWTNPPGTVAGASWNPTGGCFHNCKWLMPDGATANCYAGALANRFSNHYPQGFHHHYWWPERLKSPAKKKEPHGIFIGSMADIYGGWVLDEHILEIHKVCRKCPQHIFFTLTKNPKRMLEFDLPGNVWAGCSLPGRPLIAEQNAMNAMIKYLGYMWDLKATIKWLSIEPLWFDVSFVLRQWIESGLHLPCDWMVIGAASNGKKFHQPRPEWIHGILDVCDQQKIPVFMKDNLDWPETYKRREYPVYDIPRQMELF